MDEGAVINLTFHGVGDPRRALDPGEGDFWVSRDSFLSVLDAVVDRDDVSISFDDGNASDVELALPALKERGLSATFFVVAGRIGRPGFLDGDAIRTLAGAGMGIGCHGMRHRPWRGLDRRSLHEELVEARRVLEGVVGRSVPEAACPFGSYDRRVLGGLRRSGYRRVYTSDDGLAGGSDWLQARNTVRRGEGAEVLGRISSRQGRRDELMRRARLAVKRWR